MSTPIILGMIFLVVIMILFIFDYENGSINIQIQKMLMTKLVILCVVFICLMATIIYKVTKVYIAADNLKDISKIHDKQTAHIIGTLITKMKPNKKELIIYKNKKYYALYIDLRHKEVCIQDPDTNMNEMVKASELKFEGD